MKKLILLFAALALSSCASIEQIAMKDGKPLYQAKCRKTTADCHKLASEKCGGSYDVVESNNFMGVDHYLGIVCK